MDFIESLRGLTFQQKRILTEQAQDLVLWGGPRIEDLWPADYAPENKVQATKVFNAVMSKIDTMRRTPADFFESPASFPEVPAARRTVIEPDFKAPETIMGRCPCPDESDFLRCCNLKTLDAVQQCAFACSYCSIKNFYSDTTIKVVSDLEGKLENLEVPSGVWHIGTGQSSDSLLLGNDYGTISALSSFAEKHPEIIIELKTKSLRTDWLVPGIPMNIVATWSLNAEPVVSNEEHFTAPLEARIKAAAFCASAGRPVGFHIHPMMRYRGWETGYRDLVRLLCDSIDPSMVVMVGIGTLTFTKSNLKALRSSKARTKVTQMPLEGIAGKFSYPFEMKKQMFGTLYSYFPQDWKDSVFFYLCMEDPALWEPCLGRSYASNAEFEADMKAHYFRKIESLSKTINGKL